MPDPHDPDDGIAAEALYDLRRATLSDDEEFHFGYDLEGVEEGEVCDGE